MGEYYNTKSLLAGRAAPEFNVDALLKGAQAIQKAFNSPYEDELLANKLAEARAKEQHILDREKITDARHDKQQNRLDKEQSAQDLYFSEFAKGQQNKGGLYGDLIAKESDKYAFTDGEIGLATQYKNDPLLARAAGQNALADKLDWQLKAGEKADRFVDSNVDDESRVEMYDRIGSNISSQGLPVPKELIIAADQSRLAERTAEDAKAKLLDDQRSEIIKNQKSDAKFLINSYGNNGSSTVYDIDGNEVQINKGTASTINREYNKDVKNVGDASKTIRESVTALEGIKPEDKASALSQANRAVDILVKRGVPIDVAAETVTGELISGSKKGWFTWGKEPIFNDKAIEEHANFVVKNLPKEPVLTSGSKDVNKFDLAKEYVAGSNEDSKLELAKINADRAKLLLTPEERRNAKANQWLEREGILGKSSLEPGAVDTNGITGKPLEARINKNIKTIDGVPNSLVASEGVTNVSYKDGKGYSVAMGYNLHANKDGIEKDFSEAGISKDKAFIAKTRPQDLVLNDEEAQRLSQVAFYKYADNLDKKLGGNFDKLSPQMQTTALQMHYRGDLFNDADYAKQLQKYVAKDDFDGLVKYVSDNADSLPKPLVIRLENDLGYPTLENLRGTMTNTDKDNYLLSKSNQVKTPSGSDNKVVNNNSSSTSDISDKYIKSIFEKEKEASKDNFFGDGSTRANTNLIQSGVSQKDIDRVIQEKKDKEKSNNLIADRNYRVALRNNGIYDGKTAEEWNDLRSTTNKIGDYGWAAPVAAALAPAAMAAASIPVIANTVNGAINSIKSIGEAKRMQQMLDEAITTTSKAKKSSEDLQKIEQLKEAHKYLLQMMRRGMYY